MIFFMMINIKIKKKDLFKQLILEIFLKKLSELAKDVQKTFFYVTTTLLNFFIESTHKSCHLGDNLVAQTKFS